MASKKPLNPSIFVSDNDDLNISFNDVHHKLIPMLSVLGLSVVAIVGNTSEAQNSPEGSGPDGFPTEAEIRARYSVTDDYAMYLVIYLQGHAAGIEAAPALATLTDRTQAPATRIEEFWGQAGLKGNQDLQAAAYQVITRIPEVEAAISAKMESVVAKASKS